MVFVFSLQICGRSSVCAAQTTRRLIGLNKLRRPTVTSDLSPHRPSPPSSPAASPVVASKQQAPLLNCSEQGHPKAASLRTIPLPFPDLCARLFDGNSATGNFRSYSTQSSSVAGASSYRVPPLQITATPFDAMDDDGVHTSHHEPPPSAASPSAGSPSAASPSARSPYTATPSGNPNKRAKPSTPVAPSASPSASSPDGTSVTADDLAFEMKKALQSLTKGYTIPQFLEKLEVLQLGPTDPLRFVAYHIFGGTMNMREMWMHLADVPEILRGWLEMTGVAHDSRILSEAVADPQASFPFPPPDKYYLCDAAYAYTRGFMAPYRNVSLQTLKKQTVFLLQTADVWSTSSAAEACRCGLQTADILASEKQTAPILGRDHPY
ncbi:unnamed protein product [Lactuca saligna]|uniref:DDE Tnp4 domain-containing protein n=1 Tax=Lactuca saligna TaxID=75948 RepID=A0AA35YMI4_LACSI|nr:unnamed protein product [Lactuca saligna]